MTVTAQLGGLGQTRAALRQALGRFPTGVAVVTTRGAGDAPVGLTINSFASLSLAPPIVIWSLNGASPSLDAFVESGAFAVNVLSEEQVPLAVRFASPGPDKFGGVDWRPGRSGSPLIADCVAWFECEVTHRNRAGDHMLFAGHVQDFGHAERETLGYYRGQYFGLSAVSAAVAP